MPFELETVISRLSINLALICVFVVLCCELAQIVNIFMRNVDMSSAKTGHFYEETFVGQQKAFAETHCTRVHDL